MMKFTAKFALVSLLFAGITTAYANDQECTKLQDQKNLIYAAHGYCFKDKDAQAKYGTDCHTKKPKFSDAEDKRLTQLEARLKELNCPKKD